MPGLCGARAPSRGARGAPAGGRAGPSGGGSPSPPRFQGGPAWLGGRRARRVPPGRAALSVGRKERLL